MNYRTLLAISLILIGAAFRVLPHPWNFAPLGAIALFGGAMLNKKWGMIVPLAALLASDVIIGLYNPLEMLAVYGSFAVMVVIGRWVGRHVSVTRVLTGSLSASCLFFVVTNAAVALFGRGYTHDLAGIGASLINGVPFFRATLLSDLLYSGLFFGATVLVTRLAGRRTQTQSV